MNAFAAAAAVMAADPNLGQAATYVADGGQGGAVEVRVVLSRPEEVIGTLDAPRSIAAALAAMVPASALQRRPARGDLLILQDGDYTVAEVIADVSGAAFTLHLRRA